MIRRVSILSLLAGTLITAFPQAPALPSGAEALHSAVRSDNVAEAQRLIEGDEPCAIIPGAQHASVRLREQT